MCVCVCVCTRRGAGTDANVSIELHGDKGFIGATKLDNHQNNFERGRKDEFEIAGTDIGTPDHIVIGHDNSGGTSVMCPYSVCVCVLR